MNSEILSQIEALPGNWHGAGCLSAKVISAIYGYAEEKPFSASVETGVGKSTLVLSHCSERHIAFAADFGDSVTRTRNSELLKPESVEFVEGFCQETVPSYDLPELDFALIDGAHGYPFPELDYYYFYPKVSKGGILVVDDIHIPTIQHMFRVLKEDEMFELDQTVDTTAFFRRTDSALFDPLGDGWWEQKYNTKRYPMRVRETNGKVVPYTRFHRKFGPKPWE